MLYKLYSSPFDLHQRSRTWLQTQQRVTYAVTRPQGRGAKASRGSAARSDQWANDVPSYLSSPWKPGWPPGWRACGGAPDLGSQKSSGGADVTPGTCSPASPGSVSFFAVTAPYHSARVGEGVDENIDPNAAPGPPKQGTAPHAKRAGARCLDPVFQAAEVPSALRKGAPARAARPRR